MNALARDEASEAADDPLAGGGFSSGGGEPDSAVRPTGPHPASPRGPRDSGRFLYTSGSRPLEGYTIKRAIGRGGFGEVYFAVTDAGKEVALKLILRNHEVECRGVSHCMNLKSPNLLTIHDIKTNDEGETFVVMEYVSGPSLSQVLAKNPKGLPLHEMRAWLKGLAEGVAYLHDHGIVHRDLKPANIFLEEDVVKIGDYGLSKLINAGQGTGHSESIGTCHYMAPEISTGKYHKPIDIYAMGVIIHEMITGKVPFDGQSVGEVLMKHLTAKPDVSQLPEPFRTIVGKALAKDPKDRQSQAIELLPSEDAPKSPSIRFIGGKNSAPGTTDAEAKKAEPRGDDDVLRIGMEEPVFYIGPETRPPGARNRFQAVWKNARANRAERVAAARGRVAAGAQKLERNIAQLVNRVTQRPLPEAPPLPSGRARFAELLVSMLFTALLLGGLIFPWAVMIFQGSDAARNPERLAFLYLTTLGVTWSALIPAKLWETRRVGASGRRLAMLLLGIATGAATWELARLFHLDLAGPNASITSASLMAPRFGEAMLSFLSFFGLASAVNSWQASLSRDRRSRIRVYHIVQTGVIALILAGATSFPLNWGAGVFSLSAIACQVASPWSEQAALAAKARRKLKRVA